jgi:hypothetical protein
MADEAHFRLPGYVNKHNFRYWAPDNPGKMHQRPLHSSKVTVWCGLASVWVVGPFFFFENQNGAAATVTSARYVHMLQTFVVPQINCVGRNSGELWWQRDGATAIQPEHVWRSWATCFQTASFFVMVAFHGQQNPQTLVHVTFSVGLSQR